MWFVNQPCSGRLYGNPKSTSICQEFRQIRGQKRRSTGCTPCSGGRGGDSGRYSGCCSQMVTSVSVCREIEISCSQRQPIPKFAEQAGHYDKMTTMGIIWAIRNELAYFQAEQGISIEEYGFFDLLADLFMKMFSILKALCCLAEAVLINIKEPALTVLYISLFVPRFIFDGVLFISMQEDAKSKLIQLVIFSIELLFIMYIINVTLGTVLLPIWIVLSTMINTVFG